jgi:hypothetical protein
MKLKFKLNLQQFGAQGVLGFGSGVTDQIGGVDYNINVTGTGANWNLEDAEIRQLMEKIVTLGRPLTDAELLNEGLINAAGNRAGSDRFKNVKAAMNQLINQNASKLGFDAVGNEYDVTTGTLIEKGISAPTGADGKVDAFNQYYSDLYSLREGTSGADMLGRLEQSYMNQAQQQATMADVGFQQAAMQQAQTVKQITDQVRSERMARLRAGMSESQIANQDMQMLMTNVNTLNQNAQMLNDQRLQAQIGMNTAQDLAYTDFLNQANARGQIATGMAASDAGDPYQQTIRQMTSLYGNDPTKWTASQWSTVSKDVTGTNQNK